MWAAVPPFVSAGWAYFSHMCTLALWLSQHAWKKTRAVSEAPSAFRQTGSMRHLDCNSFAVCCSSTSELQYCSFNQMQDIAFIFHFKYNVHVYTAYIFPRVTSITLQNKILQVFLLSSSCPSVSFWLPSWTSCLLSLKKCKPSGTQENGTKKVLTVILHQSDLSVWANKGAYLLRFPSQPNSNVWQTINLHPYAGKDIICCSASGMKDTEPEMPLLFWERDGI